MSVVLHWFRRDLRLSDNLALHAACRSGAAVIPVFIFDRRIYTAPRAGAPRLAFLLAALHALDAALRQYGSRLLVRSGDPVAVLAALVAETGAAAVYLNEDYTPYARRRDAALAARLNVPVHASADALLLPPGSVLTGAGEPYTVYTPFRNNWNKQPKAPVSSLALRAEHFHPLTEIAGEPLPALPDLGFAPTIAVPPASEAAAAALLDAFIAGDIHTYDDKRNLLPAQPYHTPRPAGTSYLSPYLRLGLLSPRQAYQAAREAYRHTHSVAWRESIETWVSELTWRDFYMHILAHFPHVLERDFKDTYLALAWRDDPDWLHAWQEGRTGYPVVDAPMRQLNAIGWLPNRARMIVASFLTKDLLIHWRHGDRYFMQHLIDGDPAANNGGWQWAAGTGTDAQPYFRIFNPVSQSEKFASPAYLRHWLPELRGVPDKDIHAPWRLPKPPVDYPPPIVDHAIAREQTLAAFKQAVGK
ncbi:MAG: DNA photolyase family protein [Anaerolineae bacterium]|nr:DNA photolyase family protein [Anaerolineae bacterium]